MGFTSFDDVKKEALKGNKTAFTALYDAVYKDLFYIAYYSLMDESDAVFAIKETVIDAYAAIYAAGALKNIEDFRFWILKILCSKIKKQFKIYAKNNVVISYNKSKEQLNSEGIDVKQEFNSLPNIERLVLSIEIICGYTADKISELINYYPEKIELSMANAEIVLRERILNLRTKG